MAIAAKPRGLQSAVENAVWAAMTRDVRFGAKDLQRLDLRPYSRSGEPLRALEKYQIFEVVTAAVFARLRPDFEWSVSPNRADGGVDFVGRGPFLKSEFLGIDASILIGGECKKRNGQKALEALRGSLVNMCDTLRPTFIIGVVSAPLTSARVEAAKQLLERQLHRHCHIFGRRQIEGLIARQMDILAAVAKRALSAAEANEVLNYFRDLRGPLIETCVDPTPIVAAMGWPMSAPLEIRHTAPGQAVRMHWVPQTGSASLRLITPHGADALHGASITLGSDPIAPFLDRIELEFVTYDAGEHELGTVEIITENGEVTSVALPRIIVAADFRPAFYARPYQGALDAIAEAFARTRSGRPTIVAVTGSGGAGKTRMCEEAAIEARRQGADYIAVEQPNSSERPYRLFADLLLSLTADRSVSRGPGFGPIETLARLQPELAERAGPAILALVESAGLASKDDQALLSAFVLLISARCRNIPLVVHLQNLHWCTPDALDFIDRLIWQLQQIAADGSAASGLVSPVRVLFLLEGRTYEQRAPIDAGWSTRAFEISLDRIRCTRLSCAAFDRSQSTDFVERLFETASSAARRVPDTLLRLQKSISDAIVRASGGNPFHILEQVRLLRQQGVLAINPHTGLLHLLRPPVGELTLPDAVASTIHARWRYWASRSPGVGRLVQAAALFEDRLPGSLFHHLWRRIAPDASRQDLEALELFRFPQGLDQSGEFAFAHENYFHALAGLQLGPEEHSTVLQIYLDWFAGRSEQDPELLFIQARAALRADPAERVHVEPLLRQIISLSNAQRKQALAARATAVLLDEIAWPSIRRESGNCEKLVRACEDELALAGHLLTSGNRNLAQERIERAIAQLAETTAFENATVSVDTLECSRLLLGTMRARILYNNGDPVRAASLTEDLVADVLQLVPNVDDAEPAQRSLVMEILHAHGVATALAGDLSRALQASTWAAAVAETLIDYDQKALDVISTHGNIMIAESPSRALEILADCARLADSADAGGRLRLRLEINTAMARIVIAYDTRDSEPEESAHGLRFTADALRVTHRRANTVGRHSDAAAAALLAGLALTLLKQDARMRFAEAVGAASRAGQLETLWRAQINLAHSLHAAGESPQESAAAALTILAGTLESSATATVSPRFKMVAVPMAQAVRYCLWANDPRGAATLRRFPALLELFADPTSGQLRSDRAGFRNRDWLQVGDVDYVLY